MSTDNQAVEQEVIVIQEEKDGSATIELPESIPSPEAQHDDDSDEADERARQKEMVVGGAVDEDAEALREHSSGQRLGQGLTKRYAGFGLFINRLWAIDQRHLLRHQRLCNKIFKRAVIKQNRHVQRARQQLTG